MNRSGSERRFGGMIVSLAAALVAASAPYPGMPHALASETPPTETRQSLPSAAAGFDHLLHRAYLPSDFDQEVFDALWTTWEEPAKSTAAAADVGERRRMTMDRYGLTPHPDDPSRSLQYVVDSAGRWTMSCLACHQGTVAGRVVPGAPNTRYALETLTEEVRQVKLSQGKALGHMDLGGLLMPLGTTHGTTNAVMFGVALMQHRAADLSIVPKPPRFDLPHHDMDAPAWWHYASRKRIYADGFAPKGHRMLMQFLLVKENGPERFREWEGEFRDIEAWLESLEPPAWEGPIDSALVEQGRGLFATHCADCHGTYDGPRGGPGRQYPERMASIDEIGTDRVRFDSLTVKDRKALNDSWFAGDDGAEGLDAPDGYVAPPLDGIWASAPYFHNGSVPTLWHVLHPDERPAVWRRLDAPPAAGGSLADAYDATRVGLAIETRDTPAVKPLRGAERRGWFDTTKHGKGAGGHDYPNLLDEGEKAAVLEFLKSL
jgi:mono/diheme cytochrome c family protein